jgi:soluble lytic murein transglycosylase-like protein
MPVRVRNARPTILILLLFLGLQAGLATGTLRAAAEDSSHSGTPVTAPVASSVTPGPAADVPATDETAPAAAPAPTDPAGAALVPPERLYLEPILVGAAHDYGLPVDMVLAQAWAESSWRMDAVSRVGATGVLQLTGKTVEFVSKRLLKLDHALDAADPAANARMGARYMQHLLDRTDGDVRQALIAYNQGLTALRRNGPYPAAETYADRVLALRPVFGGGA